MVTYTMQSDNIFLRCLDTKTLEAYELDTQYVVPVTGRYWTHLGISIGSGRSHDALKIRDGEIKGFNLQRLIKDLYESRLTVNREGLCFIATGTNQEVKYHRMFDMLDWSNYGVARRTSSVISPKWTHKDFLKGHCLGEMTLDNKGKEKLHDKDDEIKKKLDDLKFLLLTCTTCEMSNTYFKKLVAHCKSPFPPSRWSHDASRSHSIRAMTLRKVDETKRLIPLDRKMTSISIVPVWFPNYRDKQVDKENWFCIKVIDDVLFHNGGGDSLGHSYGSCVLIYYDGGYEWASEQGHSSIPLPTKREHLAIFPACYFDLYHITGVGSRVGRLLK